MNWAEQHRITLRYIQPSKLQQNAYIERFHRTVRHEWLGTNTFYTIEEVQDHVTKWLWTYNHNRPNVSIRGATPGVKIIRYQTQQIAT